MDKRPWTMFLGARASITFKEYKISSSFILILIFTPVTSYAAGLSTCPDTACSYQSLRIVDYFDKDGSGGFYISHPYLSCGQLYSYTQTYTRYVDIPYVKFHVNGYRYSAQSGWYQSSSYYFSVKRNEFENMDYSLPPVLDENGLNSIFPDGCLCSSANPDDDGDGICNVNDNCVSVNNFDQLDCDSDGLGDVCDPDSSQCFEPTCAEKTAQFEASCLPEQVKYFDCQSGNGECASNLCSRTLDGDGDSSDQCADCDDTSATIIGQCVGDQQLGPNCPPN